jgi:hypothetical protein
MFFLSCFYIQEQEILQDCNRVSLGIKNCKLFISSWAYFSSWIIFCCDLFYPVISIQWVGHPDSRCRRGRGDTLIKQRGSLYLTLILCELFGPLFSFQNYLQFKLWVNDLCCLWLIKHPNTLHYCKFWFFFI